MENKYNKAYFKERNVLIPYLAETVKNIMIKKHLHKVLDVGCGTGLLVRYLNANHFDAIGCDSSPQGIKIARKNNGRVKIILAKASSLPFKDNSFDLITSVSIIEHLPQKDALKFILECKRILNKNGFIFLITPNFATPLRVLAGRKWFAYLDPTHINFYTPKTLSKLLVTNGFKNPRTQFGVRYNQAIENQFPKPFKKMPLIFKKLLIHLLFNSPLYIIRNSFWLLAQKK